MPDLQVKRAKQVLQYLQLTNEINRRAQASLAEKSAQDKTVADRVPAIVQLLVNTDRIQETQKAAVAQALQDPVQCLDIVEALAKHNPAASAVGQGRDNVKPASDRGVRVVGARVADFDETEAGRIYRDILEGRQTA